MHFGRLTRPMMLSIIGVVSLLGMGCNSVDKHQWPIRSGPDGFVEQAEHRYP